MKRLPRVALAALVALAAAGPIVPDSARAEQRGASEAGVGVGYRFGGRLSGRTDPETGESLSDIYVDGGLSFGASFGYWVNHNVILDLLWSRQPTNVESRDTPEGEEPVNVDVTIDDILVGASFHGGRAYDRVRWWGGAHLGAVIYDFASGSQTQVSMAVSAGTRTPISTHWRFITHVRSRWAYIDKTEDFFCTADDVCYRFPRTNWLQQWDLGVTIRYIF